MLVRLHQAGVPCIGIERSAEASGLVTARALEIPVVIGDARSPGTLEDLHLDRARALMALTTDDLANIQCALKARELNPDLRVVLRCFDQQLAERLDRTIDLDLTRSVADLAAPPFAAALLGRELGEPLPVSNMPLRLLETTIPAAVAARRPDRARGGGRGRSAVPALWRAVAAADEPRARRAARRSRWSARARRATRCSGNALGEAVRAQLGSQAKP